MLLHWPLWIQTCQNLLGTTPCCSPMQYTRWPAQTITLQSWQPISWCCAQASCQSPSFEARGYSLILTSKHTSSWGVVFGGKPCLSPKPREGSILPQLRRRRRRELPGHMSLSRKRRTLSDGILEQTFVSGLCASVCRDTNQFIPWSC